MVCQGNALVCGPVEVGSLVTWLRSVSQIAALVLMKDADIAESKIVRQDEDHVGFGACCLRNQDSQRG